jgi:hypothetical protein
VQRGFRASDEAAEVGRTAAKGRDDEAEWPGFRRDRALEQSEWSLEADGSVC